MMDQYIFFCVNCHQMLSDVWWRLEEIAPAGCIQGRQSQKLYTAGMSKTWKVISNV